MDDISKDSKEIIKKVLEQKSKPPRNFPNQDRGNVKGSQVKSFPNKMHKGGGRGR